MKTLLWPNKHCFIQRSSMSCLLLRLITSMMKGISVDLWQPIEKQAPDETFFTKKNSSLKMVIGFLNQKGDEGYNPVSTNLRVRSIEFTRTYVQVNMHTIKSYISQSPIFFIQTTSLPASCLTLSADLDTSQLYPVRLCQHVPLLVSKLHAVC